MKVQGKIADYTIVKEEKNRFLVNYDCESINDTDAIWYQLIFYKKQFGMPSFDTVKNTILEDINSQTDEKILSGFVWNNINVWLSAENQRNFSEAQKMAEKYGSAVLPLRFKLGENENEEAVYHTFETVEELDDFYTKAFRYVNQCLNEGWERKDAIDWTPYEELFPSGEVNVEQ